MTDTKWVVRNLDSGKERPVESRAEAESVQEDMEGLGAEVEIIPPGSTGDGMMVDCAECGEPVDVRDAEGDEKGMPVHPECLPGSEAEVVEAEAVPEDAELEGTTDLGDLPDRSVAEDPLSFLPDYMIDEVQGTPTLNKRGLSVLAFHYGVTVIDRNIIASPHETDWESAIVETTVRNADGNEFVGTGTAHVDRGDDKEVLLELAETRSYKRAVSFGTGTGIVSYQELVSEIE